MTFLIYGQDVYRSRQKLKEIIEKHKKNNKTVFDLKIFDAEDLKIEELQNELYQNSLIATQKIIVIRNVFFNNKLKEELLKKIKEWLNLKSLIIFYQENEPPKNDSFLKILQQIGKCQEFNFLEGQNLKNWIKKEFSIFGVKIEPQALDKLVHFIGNNSWQLINEIKKLAAYQQKGVISLKDVETLTSSEIETDVFKTIDAIAKKNKREAIILLKKHLNKGDNPLYLLNMINFQVRSLIEIKTLAEKKYSFEDIKKRTGFHPFVVKKNLWLSKAFSFSELKRIYQNIFKTDINIKTGKIEPEIALDLLIAEI